MGNPNFQDPFAPAEPYQIPDLIDPIITPDSSSFLSSSIPPVHLRDNAKMTTLNRGVYSSWDHDSLNISAVAKDGIELLVKARVTVRTNINQLVGGAGEATVIARVGEGIVTTVGSADSHKSVLENPDSISKAILQKGLDIGTAFQILSIDIADVDIGRNIGAHLQSLQAEADKNIAQAKAEERRAAAVALEQEMKASVVAAEAEVPKALAEALRSGRMGFKDYYDLQNLKADTNMRQSIAGESEKPSTI